MIILLGLLGGKISHRFRIPRVTGYLLTGLLVGPSVLGLVSSQTLDSMHMISDIALGLILFAIGGEFEIRHLKSMGRQVILIGLAETMGAFVLVFTVSVLITNDLWMSVLLGAISMATAPGVTLLVIREYFTRGPLTDTLLAVVALNNVISIIVFHIFFALFATAHGEPLAGAILVVLKEVFGAIAIGAVIGVLITFWEQKIDDLSELLLVIIGGLLLGIGLAQTIGISYLLVCLIIGAITNNLSMMHRIVYAELRQTEMPFYIAFFVLSGASLHLGSLAELGLLGVAYLVARPLGKALGVRLAAAKWPIGEPVKRNLGLALLPQAGVAIGLVLIVADHYPKLGEMMAAVILSSVIVYEGIGPFFTKFALGRAGEIHLQE